MWISKKKWIQLEERVTVAEQMIARLDKEIHPSEQELRDAFLEVIQHHRTHPISSRFQKSQTSARDKQLQEAL